MPMSDASQFTEYKKRRAIQSGDTQQQDPKSITKFSSFAPRVSVLNLSKFLGNPTSKFVEEPSGGGGGGGGNTIIMTLDVGSTDFSDSSTYPILSTNSGASSSNIIQIQFSNNGSENHFEDILNIIINTTSYLFESGITINTSGGGSVTGDGDNKSNLQLNISTPISLNTVITLTLPTVILANEFMDTIITS